MTCIFLIWFRSDRCTERQENKNSKQQALETVMWCHRTNHSQQSHAHNHQHKLGGLGRIMVEVTKASPVWTQLECGGAVAAMVALHACTSCQHGLSLSCRRAFGLFLDPPKRLTFLLFGEKQFFAVRRPKFSFSRAFSENCTKHRQSHGTLFAGQNALFPGPNALVIEKHCERTFLTEKMFLWTATKICVFQAMTVILVPGASRFGL